MAENLPKPKEGNKYPTIGSKVSFDEPRKTHVKTNYNLKCQKIKVKREFLSQQDKESHTRELP